VEHGDPRTSEERIILVDDHDRQLGVMEKLEAHERGALHRAFSVFLYTSDGRVVLQRRARGKYHSGGLWTNACCGHPRPGEEVREAAQRRLFEEMGIRCELQFRFEFQYRAALDNGLVEHEIDHVFTGVFDGTPVIDPDEVESWSALSMEELRERVRREPDTFTAWFPLVLSRVCALLEDQGGS
jgi:isopentenyl-diphosphate Delta-isomerase